MTPYYSAGGIDLYLGDYQEVLSTIDLSDVSMTIADPPYGETALVWDRWPLNWPEVINRLTPTNASLWCFGSMRMFLQRRAEFDSWGLAQDLVWEKNNGSGFDADRFRRVHEHVTQWYRGLWREVFKAPVMVPYTKRRNRCTRKDDLDDASRISPHRGKIGKGTWEKGTGDSVLQTSVIYSANCKGYAENETQKPEGIVRPLIQYSARPGSTILSPFAGSGTDLVVARSLGLKAIGVECREDQCEVIVRRLSQQVLDLGGTA